MNNFKIFAWIAFAFFVLWTGCKACSSDDVKNPADTHISEPGNNNARSSDINDSHLTVVDPALMESGAVFKNRMNNFFDDAGISLHIGELSTTTGKVNNTFQVYVNDHIGIIGRLNKSDNSIKEISMIGQGDGTPLSGANILLVMGLSSHHVTPPLQMRKGEMFFVN